MAATGVLVVDDDQDLRDIVVDLLRETGYTVYAASDGKPALERLRAHPEGLVVLLDLMMPGMDGYTLLQTLAAEAPLAKRHAYILFSASRRTLPSRVAEALKHLQVTTLLKPFDLDALLAAVQTAARALH
jgi:two-component system response regulator FlrC